MTMFDLQIMEVYNMVFVHFITTKFIKVVFANKHSKFKLAWFTRTDYDHYHFIGFNFFAIRE